MKTLRKRLENVENAPSVFYTLAENVFFSSFAEHLCPKSGRKLIKNVKNVGARKRLENVVETRKNEKNTLAPKKKRSTFQTLRKRCGRFLGPLSHTGRFFWRPPAQNSQVRLFEIQVG